MLARRGPRHRLSTTLLVSGAACLQGPDGELPKAPEEPDCTRAPAPAPEEEPVVSREPWRVGGVTHLDTRPCPPPPPPNCLLCEAAHTVWRSGLCPGPISSPASRRRSLHAFSLQNWWLQTPHGHGHAHAHRPLGQTIQASGYGVRLCLPRGAGVARPLTWLPLSSQGARAVQRLQPPKAKRKKLRGLFS